MKKIANRQPRVFVSRKAQRCKEVKLSRKCNMSKSFFQVNSSAVAEKAMADKVKVEQVFDVAKNKKHDSAFFALW